MTQKSKQKITFLCCLGWAFSFSSFCMNGKLVEFFFFFKGTGETENCSKLTSINVSETPARRETNSKRRGCQFCVNSTFCSFPVSFKKKQISIIIKAKISGKTIPAHVRLTSFDTSVRFVRVLLMLCNV